MNAEITLDCVSVSWAVRYCSTGQVAASGHFVSSPGDVGADLQRQLASRFCTLEGYSVQFRVVDLPQPAAVSRRPGLESRKTEQGILNDVAEYPPDLRAELLTSLEHEYCSNCGEIRELCQCGRDE